MKISKEVKILNDELIELRRDFHKHPELGFEEFRTSKIISNYLRQCHLEVKRLANTGVVGLLKGNQEGRTLMLRADIDAIPVQEENKVPYRSVYDGKMHACGHDGHTAMLLVAAKILSGRREELKGNIKFVFEPNEENVGAVAMIEEGVLENPPVDACLGIHLWSPLESGKIGISMGPIMAGTDHFEIKIKGKGGHTGAPHSAIDPIFAAADLIQAIHAIQTREIDVLKPTLIMVGKVQGGTAGNVIPDTATLDGTIRYLYEVDDILEENPRIRLERIVDSVCRLHRTKYELSYPFSHPPVINERSMVELVQSVAEEVLGDKENLVSYRCMGGDDFSEFAARLPGAYYFLGTGNPDKETQFSHHHPRFNIDEEILKIGVEMHTRTAMKYLGI